MIIKEMGPAHSGEWFGFFDSRAFSDNPEWKGCYCTAFFLPRLPEFESASRKRKDYAEWLVAQGLMRGYLAYEHGMVVGWCNVNRKTAFPRLAGHQTEEEGILSIACFIVQKEYRGQGIAQKLLDRAIKDAKRDGIRVIEAYPKPKSKTESGNWHGPYSMYEKNGFRPEKVGDLDVVRRYL